MIFKGGILGGMRNFRGDPYLNGTTVSFGTTVLFDSAEVSNAKITDLTPCDIGVDEVAAEPVTCEGCVDRPKDSGIVSCKGVDGEMTCPFGLTNQEELSTNDNLTKYLEVEQGYPQQVSDIQGRLKRHLPFWRDVLRAPPPILDCIEHGTFLHHILTETTTQQSCTECLWMRPEEVGHDTSASEIYYY